MGRRADVVNLDEHRANRREPGARFVLETRDAGSDPETGAFLWSWFIEDNLDAEQYRPNTRQFGEQLRRIADRYDPQPVRPVSRRRHRVRRA